MPDSPEPIKQIRYLQCPKCGRKLKLVENGMEVVKEGAPECTTPLVEISE